MSTDTDVAPTVPGEMRAGVFLKPDPSPGAAEDATRLDLICRILGHTTDVAIGQFIGMADRTVVRARKGILGEAFIASVLSALAEHETDLAQYGITTRFEDVFEVREKAASA